jgi:calcium/calmodulin-dependent protein kinase I
MYAAPEALESQGAYREPSDMWSIGILTYTLLTGFFPFKNNVDEAELRRSIAKKDINWQPFAHLPPEAVDFIESLLHLDPKRRLNSEEALEHVWI